jgi:hypothetical protein
MSKRDDVPIRTNPRSLPCVHHNPRRAPFLIGALWARLTGEIVVEWQPADCGPRRASGGRAPGDHFLRHAHCSPSMAPFLLGADRGWLQEAWEGAA